MKSKILRAKKKLSSLLSWILKGDNAKDFKFFKNEVSLAEKNDHAPAGIAHFNMILKDLPIFASKTRKYVLNHLKEYKKKNI